MNNWLLVISIVVVISMLGAINYQSLSDYAEYRASPYYSIAGAEPVFEPRIIEPLISPPDVRYPFPNQFGYTSSEHSLKDDSVSLRYEDPETGAVHTQTYMPGQTFAYGCYNRDGRTVLPMYQYLGSTLFQDARSLVLIDFELDVPGAIPCTFPGYLENTVDAYDAADLEPYGLDRYRAQNGDQPINTTYIHPIRSSVMLLEPHIDPLPVELFNDENSYWFANVQRHPGNDSITVAYGYFEDGQKIIPDSPYTSNYSAGQTFLGYCTEYGDSTLLGLYQYRGTVDIRGADSLILVHFNTHTRVPVPCTYPDIIIHSTDTFDTSRFDRQYDLSLDFLSPAGAT